MAIINYFLRKMDSVGVAYVGDALDDGKGLGLDEEAEGDLSQTVAGHTRVGGSVEWRYVG